jgi:RNA polymerase sigma-70 factor (ECF subfamily)
VEAPHPDLNVARRAQAGDESAWREIVTLTRDRLFALLAHHVGDREEAIDLLQETYLHAVRGLPSYSGRGSLEAWLCGIALRRARGWKRRFLPRRVRELPLDEASTPASAAAEPPDPDEGRRLRQALAGLPERQRSALLLHEWMGYGFAEVAAALAIGEATARVHCFRARETLRAVLSRPAALTSRTRVQEQRP